MAAPGVPAPTLSEVPGDALPTGVTFSIVTGVRSETPAPGTGGPYTLHLTAANAVAPNVTPVFALSVQ